jgi:hypothetical protein
VVQPRMDGGLAAGDEALARSSPSVPSSHSIDDASDSRPLRSLPGRCQQRSVWPAATR